MVLHDQDWETDSEPGSNTRLKHILCPICFFFSFLFNYQNLQKLQIYSSVLCLSLAARMYEKKKVANQNTQLSDSRRALESIQSSRFTWSTPETISLMDPSVFCSINGLNIYSYVNVTFLWIVWMAWHLVTSGHVSVLRSGVSHGSWNYWQMNGEHKQPFCNTNNCSVELWSAVLRFVLKYWCVEERNLASELLSRPPRWQPSQITTRSLETAQQWDGNLKREQINTPNTPTLMPY